MAKSKLPRSTPAARPNQAPPPPKAPEAGSQSAKLSMPGGSTPPRSASPSSLNDADSSSLSASAKKKKKKSKARAKDSEYVDEHDFDLQAPNLAQRPRSPTSLAARAQAQAQLLAAASELYRRIEGDPQGIPDDDAYWTSLPAHLRTFIRNALPLGQFPPAAQAALEGNPNDPKNRHDSTKAMIAVAQQLAQAAHASQRHLQQYPSGNHAYPPLPFDPSIFADLALHPDQPMPPLSHPTSNSTQHATTNGTYAQYSSSPNPPPTQPPVEPLPPPVVLYNNFEDDADRYDDRDDGEEYCSYDELEADAAMLDPQGNLLRHRNGVWVHDDSDHVHGPNGTAAISDGARTSSKSNKKKKKKKKASSALNPADDDLHDAEPEAPIPPKPVPSHPTPTTNVSSVNRSTNPPPPSSRAAGKQPMTFNSNSKSTARPMNGTGTLGKRPVSSSAHGQLNPTVNNAKIWSTSSAEERERIKEFWLGLSMKDRQKLVQVEKETVLKKMKEQQRHLCSCAVCGRKRSAIEDELEVLYDAYYDELEDYANHQQRWVTSGGTIPPPPGPGPFPGSVALDSSGAVIGGDPLSKARGNARDGRHSHSHHHHHHHHGQQRSALHPESSDGYDDEELDDDADYDDEDDDADYDDEDEEDDLDLERERVRDDFHKRAPVVPAGRRRGADDNDLFGLGNSLTVKGGILTVADDMLKNDGRKFLEMMEQLAERRMHREELTGAELALDDEDEDDDHPDDLDDEDDLEDDEDEEEDNILTDEQRMEEGRKMFQIFAARMFEQRVLQAYRERVAQERQLQLLRELEEEDSNEKAREARRQKETQKKKDKKKAQKEAKDAEKNRKDLEKAAAEAEVRAQLQAVRDAELKKQEEIRLKKEAERKLKDEEKAKKDEEKRRRLAEERERELERERKRKEKEEKARLEREALEQAKRDKEEEARKVKEEQERVQREKAEKERKAKEEQERKSDALKKEKEAKAQAQRDAKQAASAPAAPARTTPVSPAGARSAASKSPGPVHAQAGRNAKSGSIPSSPAVPPSTTRAAGGSRGGAAQKFTTTSMPPGLTAAPASSASTLPAPPQGLPPRPSTAVLTPTGTVSQGSSVSVAASAGLPRPPVNSGVPTSMPPLGFGSIGVASPNAPSHVPQAPTSMSPQLASSFAHDKSHPTSHAHSAIGAPGTRSADSYSSPTLPNGMAAGSGGDSGMPPGLGGMASGLASLNLGGNSMHPGMSMASAPGQSTFSPIGSGQDALRSRTTSFADTDPMAAFGGMRPSSSTAQRANYRPSQPAPIGPIGRPKAVDAIHQEDHAGHFGNGRSSSNTSGSGATSPRLPEGILGSSALGGDDDIIDPKPRRTSHTIPIGGGATGSSAGGGFYGAGGPVGGGGGFGMGPASSPWSSFSAGGGGAQSAQGPLSPAFNSGSGPGAIGSTAFAPGPGAGSAGMAGAGQPDPWSRAPTSWDRARYAFEQPGGSGAGSGSSSGLGSIGGALHGSGPQPPPHHSLGMAPGSSPFGLGGGAPPGPRNLFGAPGSGGSAHPGAIGALPSALSPTSSAATRHLGGKHD